MVDFLTRFIVWMCLHHRPSDVTRKIYSGNGFERQKDGTLKLLDQQEIGK